MGTVDVLVDKAKAILALEEALDEEQRFLDWLQHQSQQPAKKVVRAKQIERVQALQYATHHLTVCKVSHG